MNIIINRQSLLDAMTVAKSVIPSRSPKPILQCVKLAAKKDALILSATDLSLSIEYRIDAVQVHKPGELLLDAAAVCVRRGRGRGDGDWGEKARRKSR